MPKNKKKFKKISKLTIDRSKWINGSVFFPKGAKSGTPSSELFEQEEKVNDKYGYTALLNQEGMMCCLGFACKAAGVPKDRLIDRSNPEHAAEDTGHLIPNLTDGHWDSEEEAWEDLHDSDFSRKAIDINDSCQYKHRATREADLKKLFHEYGIELKFTGRAPRSIR